MNVSLYGNCRETQRKEPRIFTVVSKLFVYNCRWKTVYDTICDPCPFNLCEEISIGTSCVYILSLTLYNTRRSFGED